MKRLVLLGLTSFLLVPLLQAIPAFASVRCHGLRPTKTGTRRDDRLVGTRRSDVIAGLGGDDVIIGRGGNDVICGGGGNDLIDGMQGRDTAYGDNGYDACTASTSSEHQFHYACETHGGAPYPEDSGFGSSRVSSAPAGSQTPPLGAATPSGAYYDAPSASCAATSPNIWKLEYLVNTPYTTTNDGGIFPSPLGRVAIRPFFWIWDGGAAYQAYNGWRWLGFQDWEYNDVAVIPDTTLGYLNATFDADPGYYLVGLEFYWSDGTNWVTYAYDYASEYVNNFGPVEYSGQSWCIV